MNQPAGGPRGAQALSGPPSRCWACSLDSLEPSLTIGEFDLLRGWPLSELRFDFARTEREEVLAQWQRDMMLSARIFMTGAASMILPGGTG